MLIIHLLLARAGHQRCWSTSLVLHLLHVGLHRAGILEHHIRTRDQTSLIGTSNQCRVVQLLSLSLHHLHDLVIGEPALVELADLIEIPIGVHDVISLLILNFLCSFPFA